MRKCDFTFKADRLDQSCLFCSAQALNTEQNHGGLPLSGSGEMCVKIVVEGDADPIRPPRLTENLSVIGSSHSDLAHVKRVESASPKDFSRLRRQPLIHQNRIHATRSMPKLSSSTVTAA